MFVKNGPDHPDKKALLSREINLSEYGIRVLIVSNDFQVSIYKNLGQIKKRKYIQIRGLLPREWQIKRRRLSAIPFCVHSILSQFILNESNNSL